MGLLSGRPIFCVGEGQGSLKEDDVADKSTYIQKSTGEIHNLTTEVYEGLMDDEDVSAKLDEIIQVAEDLKITFYEGKTE
jgi:hypothetical protein